jgi:sister-chromatid-cohesion protein PDS5
LAQDELIKRLKKLANVLADTDQIDEESEARETIKPVAKTLVRQNLIKHSNKDIRLIVACCLSDILRILAPETD